MTQTRVTLPVLVTLLSVGTFVIVSCITKKPAATSPGNMKVKLAADAAATSLEDANKARSNQESNNYIYSKFIKDAIYRTEYARYKVFCSGGCLVEEETNAQQDIDGSSSDAIKESRITFRPQASNYEIIVYSSEAADGGYEWPENWSYSTEPIIINNQTQQKAILRNENGEIARIIVLNIHNLASLKYWIEVNFFSRPSKKDLKRVNRFLESFEPF